MPLVLITAPTSDPLTIAEAKRQLRLNATTGEPAPTAPTVALASPAAPGNVDNGDHRVGYTFVTADGETEIGPLSAIVTVANKAVNGQIAVTNIALGGTAVTARKAYLVPVAGGAAKFAATLNDNTSTTQTINVADSALGASAPTTNTTEDPELVRLLTTVRDRAELATGRALVTQTWDLVLDAFPCGRVIDLPRPPLVSVTYLKYVDTAGVLQTWAAANYVVQAPAGPRSARGRLALAYGKTWPSTYGELGDVTIRLVCGYGAPSAVPALLKDGMLLDLGFLYGGGQAEMLPERVRDLYRSFKSYPPQRRWMAA